jgi:diguanylate cyclase (GGDEF)-like protein
VWLPVGQGWHCAELTDRAVIDFSISAATPIERHAVFLVDTSCLPASVVNTPHGQSDDLRRREGDVRDVVDRVEEIATIRSRHDEGLGFADRWSTYLMAAAYLVVTGAVLISGGWPAMKLTQYVTWLALIGLYAVAYDTIFAAATGSAVPTQPILAAMLLTLPLQLVPISVLAGVLVGAALKPQRGHFAYRYGLNTISAWHCLGPVAVLAAANLDEPALRHWPWYLLALGAQFLADATVGVIRTVCLGSSVKALWRPLAWTFGIDAMLAPFGLTAAIAADARPEVLLLLIAPIGLIRLLALDRTQHLEQAITLGRAFAQVSSEARVDVLTGAANRRVWEESLIDAQAAIEAGEQVVVVMADVDHLKLTNDTLGHSMGDRLICEAVEILGSAAPPGALIARLGGDEFGILVGGVTSPSVGAAIVSHIRDELDRAARMGNAPVSLSLGFAACPPFQTIGAAIESADAAVSEDKAARRVSRDDLTGLTARPFQPRR